MTPRFPHPMKRLPLLCGAVWLACTALYAGPTERAILAAMRLADAPNYTWNVTISDDARTYDIHGRTQRQGFTRVKMPVINTVRRQLGRGVTDTQISLIFRGNVACVIETEKGWLRPDELPSPDDAESGHDSLMYPLGIIGHAGARSLPGSVIKGSIIRPSAVARSAPEREQAYSNLQLAISPPHEELGVIVSSHQEFLVEGDTVTGTLTDLGAQLLLVRDGQKEITPVRAAGTFKLWIRDGAVFKYQVGLQGILSVETRTSRRDILVQQTATTTLHDVGTTSVDVPAEALAKLQ